MDIPGRILVQHILSRCYQNVSFPSPVHHNPWYLGISVASVHVKDLREWSQECQLATAVLRQHLHWANNRMKHFADLKQSDRVFQVGDWVYLWLQPYIQT
jgi:hypothetical protein